MSELLPKTKSNSSSISDSAASGKSSLNAKKVYRSGIGGRGNYHRIFPTDLPPMPPSVIVPPRPQRLYSSGIGGAGNHHSSNNRSFVDQQEQLERERIVRGRPRTRHHGIGGFGNFTGNNHRYSTAVGASSSKYSSVALPYGALDRLQKKISKTLLKKKPSTDCHSEK